MNVRRFQRGYLSTFRNRWRRRVDNRLLQKSPCLTKLLFRNALTVVIFLQIQENPRSSSNLRLKKIFFYSSEFNIWYSYFIRICRLAKKVTDRRGIFFFSERKTFLASRNPSFLRGSFCSQKCRNRFLKIVMLELFWLWAPRFQRKFRGTSYLPQRISSSTQ